MVLPEGWTETGYEYNNTQLFRHTDGREQKGNPGNPEGVIAIANVIPDMGALTLLNLSSNNLKAESAKIVAEAMKVTNYSIVSFWYRFHSHLTTATHRITEQYPL
jgi:hypothetical protein